MLFSTALYPDKRQLVCSYIFNSYTKAKTRCVKNGNRQSFALFFQVFCSVFNLQTSLSGMMQDSQLLAVYEAFYIEKNKSKICWTNFQRALGNGYV